MIRLVALDLDGTLLGPDWRISEADQEACRLAQERGVQLVINTSRWYGLAMRTARRLGLTTPLVCYNGAHVQEPDDGRELLHLTIPMEVAREIAAFCDELGCEAYVTVAGITYMRNQWQEQVDPQRLPQDMRFAKRHAPHVTAPATGILVMGEDAAQAVVDRFAPRYGDLVQFPIGASATMAPYVTVTARGVDKGTGLRLVCEHLGIAPEETMAVGDTAPDIAMFTVAGVGVAMGNAPDEVRAQADAVAPSNSEGGVAWAIRRFVLEEG